jgi:hypothetical protein
MAAVTGLVAYLLLQTSAFMLGVLMIIGGGIAYPVILVGLALETINKWLDD